MASLLGFALACGDGDPKPAAAKHEELIEPADVCFPESEAACNPAGVWRLVHSASLNPIPFGEGFEVTEGADGTFETNVSIGDHQHVRVDEGCRLVITSATQWEAEDTAGTSLVALIADLRGDYGRGFLVEEEEDRGTRDTFQIRLLRQGIEAPHECTVPPTPPGAVRGLSLAGCVLENEWRVHRDTAPSAACTDPGLGLDFSNVSVAPQKQAVRIVPVPGDCRLFVQTGTIDARAGNYELRSQLELRTIEGEALVDVTGPCAVSGLMPAVNGQRRMNDWRLKLVDAPEAAMPEPGAPLFTVEISHAFQRLRPWDLYVDVYFREDSSAEARCTFRDQGNDGFVDSGDAYDCVNGESAASEEGLAGLIDITVRQYLVGGGNDYLRNALTWVDE